MEIVVTALKFVATVGKAAASVVGVQLATTTVAGMQAALAIGSAIIAGTAVLANKAMAMFEIDMPQVDSDASRQRTVKSTTEPYKIIYGETLVSGPISFIGMKGTNNEDLYHVIALAGHEVTDITDIYFDNELISDSAINSGSSAGGNVTSGIFGPRNSTTICIINKHLGTATQAADSMMVNAFTDYTSAHQGKGIAYIAMKWKLNEDSAEVWEKYAPSDIKAIVKGKPVYDPRLDTGGVGNNPADDNFITYSATVGSYVGQGQNPALILADYLINDDFGMGIASSKIDWNAIVTAANGCDVSVDVPNNATEKRFTCNGVLFGTDSHRRNITKILSSMNGSLVYSNGKYVLHAGIFEAATEDLNEDDLIAAIGIKTSFERSDRFNTIKGLFVDPAQNHKSSEFPKVQLADAVNRDNQEILEKEVQYPMTNSSYMAQRLSYKLIKLSDQQKVVSFPANLSALRIKAGDRVRVSVEELSWSNKVFQCVGWTFSDEGGVNLTLREDAQSAYDDPSVTPTNEYSTITASGDITDAFRGVPSPSSLSATAGLKNIELNWVNPLRPADYGTIYVYASPNSNFSSAVKIGETDGTQFIHDGSNPVDSVSVDDVRHYWVRAIKNVGTDSSARSDLSNSDSATVGAVEWTDVANPTIGIDINNDTISINTGVANTTTGQTVATSGIEAGTTVTQGGITMNQGGSIKGGQSAYNTGTGFFLGYDSSAYKFSIGNASNEALTFDGTNLAVSGDITATSGTFTGTVNASAGAFTGDVSTDSKFIAGSGATSATMDGNDTNFKFYAGAAAAGDSPFKVDADGVVTADRIVITRPDDPSAVIFDSAQDGLVGVGLSSLSVDSDNAVAQVADELTSNTDYARLILSANAQTLTIKVLFPLGYAPFAISSAEDFPDTITLTLQVATVTNGTPGTFNNITGGSKTFTRRVYSSGAPSDDDYYSVYDSGTSWYKKGKDAIDGQFNLVMTSSGTFTAGDKAIRVQVSYVAGSGATNANPSSSSKRTLYFNSSTQYFTINDSDIIRDQAAGSLLTGDVILSAPSGARSISWRDSDTQDENWSIETETHYNPNSAAALYFKYDNGSTAPIAFASNGNILTLGDFITTAGAIAATTASIGGGYGSTGLSIAADGNLSTDGSVIIGGNLTVQGTTTTVDTDNLTVKDNNITLNYSTGDSSSTANNAGITIQDAVDSTTDASLLWKTASDSFEFSHNANIPKTYVNATSENSVSGTWNNASSSASWGSIKFGAGYSWTDGVGAYKQFNIPTGADTCYMSQLKWNSGGYVDVHGVQADGDLVFLGRIATGQTVENNNHGNTTEHDGQAIDKIGSGLDAFSAIRITNRRGRFHFTGLAFSTQHLDNFNGGMIAAEMLHSGVLSNVENTNWDAAYTYSQVGHLPLTGGTLTGQLNIKTTGADTIVDIKGNGSYDPILNLRSDQGGIATEGFQIWYDNSVGDVHLHTTYPSDVAAIRFHTRTANDKATNNERFTINGNGLINITTGNLAMNGSTVISNDRSIDATSIEVTGSYSGGSGDMTNVTNAQLKIGSAGTSDYWRIPHFSQSTTTSGVYNYQTGKNVYWGEPTDTGTYYFRGRNLEVSNGNVSVNGTITGGNITAGNSSTSNYVRAHHNDGSYMTLEGYGLIMNRSASYIRPTTDGDKSLYIGAADASLDWASILFRSVNGLYMTGTQFLTANRDLVNIGTISSGAITSSGLITAKNAVLTDDGSASPILKISADDNGPWAIQLYREDLNGGPRVFASDTATWSFDGHVNLRANYAYKVNGTTVIDANTRIQGQVIGVNNTNNSTKYGISLYGGSAYATNPTYGMMFSGTTYSGTHGSVSGDWATYFTMNSTSTRGWIFRDQSTPTNVASISATGNAAFNGTLSVYGNQITMDSTAARVKYRVWDDSNYGIGMGPNYNFGAINNQYVMSFQMSDNSDRGFWWGDTTHTNAQGAMALSTDGYLTVASGMRLGFGESDTTHPIGGLQVSGKIFGYSGQVWSGSTQGTGTGSIHLNPNTATDDAGPAITFGASDSGGGANAQSGIYIQSDDAYGTKMYLSTTDNYSSGSKTALSIDSSGNVSLARGQFQMSGVLVVDQSRNITAAQGNFTGSFQIGGAPLNNPYNAISSTRLMFGGGDANAQTNYYIGTNLENFGGNYTKLDLRWHTGIRMGAQGVYGGIRFYSNEDLTSKLMSIGEGNGNTDVKVYNNLNLSAATNTASGIANARLINVYGSSSQHASLVLEGNVASSFLVVNSGLSASNTPSIFFNNALRFATASNKNSTGFAERLKIDSTGVQPTFLSRSSSNTGHFVGTYNNIGANGTHSNPIYTIGSSYNPALTTLTNMYGIGYTSTGSSFISFAGASNWGMYVAADGDARIWLDGSNGVISAKGAIYGLDGFYVGDGSHGQFYTDSTNRTAFRNAQFYIQSNVSAYYNYANTQYHGPTSGANLYFRGNALTGNSWSIGATGVAAFTTGSYSNDLTVTGDIIVNGNQVYTAASSTRVKFAVWSDTNYGIGMGSGYTFGPIANDYAMSFQMNNASNRGFWWGDNSHTNAQGAMALSTDGYLSVAAGMRIGYGESDTTKASLGIQSNYMIAANGGLSQDGHTLINGSDTWYRTLSSDGIFFQSYAGGLNMVDTTWVRVYNGKALYVPNQIAASGNITAYYSDERLKTKTGNIENALDKVRSLSGFKYVENDLAKELGYTNEKQQVGLSAQRVQAVLPEAVSLAPVDMETDEFSGEITSKSGENYLTVDYSRLVPLLVEAIKEQQEQIDELKLKLKEK